MIDLGTLEAEEYIRALNNHTRVKILSMCVENPFPLYQISRILSISQPTVSKHVDILVDTGLIERIKKNGKIYLHTTRCEFRFRVPSISPDETIT